MPASRDECHLCHIHDHNHPSTLLRTSTLRDASPPSRARRHSSRGGSMDRDYHRHHRDHHHHHHHNHHHDKERRHSRSGRVPSALARLSEHNSHSLPASRSNTLNLYPEQVSVLPDGGHRFIGGDRVSVRSLELTSPRHTDDNGSHHSLQQTTTLQKPLSNTLGSSFMPLHSHGGSHLSLQQATVMPSSQDRAQDYYLQVNRLPYKEDARKHRFNLQTVLLIGCYTLLFVMAIIIGLVLCHQNGWLGFGSPVSLAEVVEDRGVHGIPRGSVRRPNFDHGRLTNQNFENEPSNELQHLTLGPNKHIPVHNVVHVRKQEPSNLNSSPVGRPRSISGTRDHLNENQQTQTIPGNRPVQRVPEDVFVNDGAVVSSSDKKFQTTNGATSGRNTAPENKSASTGSTDVNNSGRTMTNDRLVNSVPSNGNENSFTVNGQPKQQTENIFLPRGPIQTTHFTTNNLPVATHAGPAQIGSNVPQTVQLPSSQNGNGVSVVAHPTQGQVINNVHGRTPVLSNQNANNFPSNGQAVSSHNIPITSLPGTQNGHTLAGRGQISNDQNRDTFLGGHPTSSKQNENNSPGGVQTSPSQIGKGFPVNIQTLAGNTASQIIAQNSNIPNSNGAQTAPNVGKTLVITEQIQTRPDTGNAVLKKQPLRIILNAGHLSTSHESNPPSGIAPFSSANGKLQQNSSPPQFVQAAAIINGHKQGISTLTQINPATNRENSFSSIPSLNPLNSFRGDSGTLPRPTHDEIRFISNTPLHQANPSQGPVRSSQPVQVITTSRIPGTSNANTQSTAPKPQLNVQNIAPPLNQNTRKTTGSHEPGKPPSNVISVKSQLQPTSPAGVPSNTFTPQIVHSEFSTVPPSVNAGPIFVLHAQNDLHPSIGQTKAPQQIPRQRLPIPSTDQNLNRKQTVSASGGQDQPSRKTTQGISLHAVNPNVNKVKKVQNSAADINDIHMEKMKILKEILDAEGSGKLLQDLITLKNNKNSISQLSEQLSESAANHRPSQSSGESFQKSLTTAPLSNQRPPASSDQEINSASKSAGQVSKVQVRPNHPERSRQPQSSRPNANTGANSSKNKKRNNIQVVRELLASLISSPEVQEILSTRNRQGKRAELNAGSSDQLSGKDSAKGQEMRALLMQALAKEIPSKRKQEDAKPKARQPSVEESPAQKRKETLDSEQAGQRRRTITRAQQLAHFSTGTPGRVITKRIGTSNSQQGSREHQSVRPPTPRTSRGRRTHVDHTRVAGSEQIPRRKAKSIRRTAEGASDTDRPRGVVRHWRTTDQHGTMSQGTVRSDGSFAFTNCRPAQMCHNKSIP
ncbi:hypothetical protein FHG87_001800 [Trinorchestia longiramus]|nr:hypothetical protein FHG87_001800 [Trinorchestia longiramus]